MAQFQGNPRRDSEELSAHEVVSRYTSRLEALFVEHGGKGASLMQKAEPFNFALSEGVWDDLCWLNSEGRGVAEHDLDEFRRVAESVIEAVESAPRRASAAPRPTLPRPASAPMPKADNDSFPVKARPKRRSAITGWLICASLLAAGYYWQGDLLGLLRASVQKLQDAPEGVASRGAPNPSPSDHLPDAGDADAMASAAKPPGKRRPRAPSTLPLTRTAPNTRSSAVPTAVAPEAEASHGAGPQTASEPASGAPADRAPEPDNSSAATNAHGPGSVRMTPDELRKF
jgi:hypothetical protein